MIEVIVYTNEYSWFRPNVCDFAAATNDREPICNSGLSTTVTPVFVRTTIATIIAFIGDAAGAIIGTSARKHLIVLINAALGALLAVATLDILPDAKALLNWWQLIFAAGSGYLLFWLIGKYVYPICPACALNTMDGSSLMMTRTLVLLMFALGVHSTMDGAAVVLGDDVVRGVNYPVFFAISFHKLPEGMALVLLLIGAGYSRKAAFLWTMLIESTTELGALGAVLLIHNISNLWLGLLFANVGGGFLYLVLNTMVLAQGHTPDVAVPTNVKNRVVAGGVAYAVTGAIILATRSLG